VIRPAASKHPSLKKIRRLCFLLSILLLAACSGQMSHQPRHDPLEASYFWEDGRASRDLIPGTVARGLLREDTHFYEAMDNGTLADTFPFPVTMEVMERGQIRYNIYCAPCHGHTGHGDGMIVQRGFTPPNSFHDERLRMAPEGYYFSVITNGFGAMYSYAYRIPPEDRWAIIAYIRALQFSQYAPVGALSPQDLAELERLGD
jgi:mono/diheme cytochrome c family protein